MGCAVDGCTSPHVLLSLALPEGGGVGGGRAHVVRAADPRAHVRSHRGEFSPPHRPGYGRRELLGTNGELTPRSDCCGTSAQTKPFLWSVAAERSAGITNACARVRQRIAAQSNVEKQGSTSERPWEMFAHLKHANERHCLKGFFLEAAFGFT